MIGRGRHAKCVLLCCALLALAAAGSGCWSRKELDAMAIIVATGVDLQPGGYLLTVQASNPAALGVPGGGGAMGVSSRSPSVSWEGRGSSIPEAVRCLERVAQRRLLWSDSRLIVIGEEAARAGIAPILDALMRHYQPRLTQWVFVTPGWAQDVLRGSSCLEVIPAMAIDRQARLFRRTGDCGIRNLYQVAGMLMDRTGNAFTGVVKPVTALAAGRRRLASGRPGNPGRRRPGGLPAGRQRPLPGRPAGPDTWTRRPPGA